MIQKQKPGCKNATSLIPEQAPFKEAGFRPYPSPLTLNNLNPITPKSLMSAGEEPITLGGTLVANTILNFAPGKALHGHNLLLSGLHGRSSSFEQGILLRTH